MRIVIFDWLLIISVAGGVTEAASQSFQFLPESKLTYFESGERVEPFVCPDGQCTLQLEGKFGFEFNATARTAAFVDVDVQMSGVAPNFIDDDWFSDLLENKFEPVFIEEASKAVFQHTFANGTNPGLLTVETDGLGLVVSGGYDLRSLDGDGVVMRTAANLIVPEPTTLVLVVGIVVHFACFCRRSGRP